jgi:hypothetical protein
MPAKRVCQIQRQAVQYALDRALANMFNRESLPCSARRCQPCIQVNVDTIGILRSDKATIPFEGTSGDDYLLTLPNATVLGLGQRSSLNTGYRYVILVNIKPKLS